jgi:hypothetical protein
MRALPFLLVIFSIVVLAPSISLHANTPAILPAVQGADTANGKRVLAKLNSIIIDKCNYDFQYDDLRITLSYLTTRSKELDPEREGVRFVLQGPYKPPPLPPGGKPIHREISLSLSNLLLIELLGYICQVTDHSARISDDAVIVFPAVHKSQNGL